MTDYTYRADGVKVKKLFGTTETHYVDGFHYKTVGSEIKLVIIPTSEGYFDAQRDAYFYNFTDHLGNVRLSYSDADGNGVVTGDVIVHECSDGNCNSYIIPGETEGISNYYPFGMLLENHNNQAANSNVYKYKYNGKELQEAGMYDYGARFYMSDIGRWGVVDLVAEKMTRHSPYNYAFNDPIKFIDPDGRAPLTDYKLQNGKIERVNQNDGTEDNLNDRLFIYDKDGNKQSNEPFTISKDTKKSDTMISDLSETKKETSSGPLSYTDSDNLSQALDLYQFIALNTTNEWSFENHGGMAIFGTFENGFSSPNFSSAANAVKGFSESSLTYDIYSHGTKFGTNGPSSTYFPDEKGSDMTFERNSEKARFIFRTNNNPNKDAEKGTVWQYGKGVSSQTKIQSNFSRTNFSQSPIFNRK